MVEEKRDLDSLLGFLTFAKKNGYFNPGTADNRIRAVREVFSLVKNIDTSDVTKIDTSSILTRYTTLSAGKIPTATLRGYHANFRTAIREFDNYIADPTSYKPPSLRRRAKTPSETPSVKPSRAKQPITPAESPSAEFAGLVTPIAPSLHIDIQIHISPEASDTQIDKVFESMAKHFKDLYNSTK